MEWRKIEQNNNYSISDRGDVRNDKTGRILKPHKSTSGYYQIMLGRKQVPQYVHRLEAIAFLDNPKELPQVDHKNGDKLDNRIENLRWVTASENTRGFGYESRIEKRKKKIKAVKGNEVLTFESRTATAEYFKCNKSQIEYNKIYKKGLKKGWKFEIVEDIV